MARRRPPSSPHGNVRRALELLRRSLDDWFYTGVRYAGLGLLVYSIAIDRIHNPALLPAATGLMFLKNVRGND